MSQDLALANQTLRDLGKQLSVDLCPFLFQGLGVQRREIVDWRQITLRCLFPRAMAVAAVPWRKQSPDGRRVLHKEAGA